MVTVSVVASVMAMSPMTPVGRIGYIAWLSRVNDTRLNIAGLLHVPRLNVSGLWVRLWARLNIARLHIPGLGVAGLHVTGGWHYWLHWHDDLGLNVSMTMMTMAAVVTS